MRKINVRREFAKAFVMLTVLITLTFSFRRSRDVTRLWPAPEWFRDQPVLWRIVATLVVAMCASAIITGVVRMTRSEAEWQDTIANELFEPSRTSLYVGWTKVAIGVFLVLAGFVYGPFAILGGLLMAASGAWWVLDYDRRAEEYEAKLARRQRLEQ